MDLSVISYYGKQISKCGYCKGTKCSIAHGMHAFIMAPQDYQDLIDRGWRRSGCYCYKPDNQTTCCPCYTIKCNALEFKLSKSHKKVLKRINRFLRDGKKEKNDETFAAKSCEEAADEQADTGGGGLHDEPTVPNIPIPVINVDAIAASTVLENRNMSTEHVQDAKNLAGSSISISPTQSTEQKPPCKKAKQMRLERRRAKLAAKGMPIEMANSNVAGNKEKNLADYLAEPSDADKHKLKIVLVPAKCEIVSPDVFDMYVKYKIFVHNGDPQRLLPTNFKRFLCNSPIQLYLVPVDSSEFKRTLTASYAIYKRFQTAIHNDPPKNVSEYLDFLKYSPLKHTKPKNGPYMGFGSFHQQYWLDDKLIAVGVIDILPYCVSSVYFFYDPDYSFLSLGTYGSLREIDLVQQLSRTLPTLHNYYMGFYIHKCPKMRYKGKLTPSYLLCAETYTWQLLTDELRDKLDLHKYLRFNTDPSAKDDNEFHANDLDFVPLVIENRCLLYKQYIQAFKIETVDNMLDIIRSRIYKHITGEEDDRDLILEYGKLVGRPCAHRLRFFKA